MNREEIEEVWNKTIDPASMDNIEQREARQAEVDAARHAQMSRLSPDDQKKYVAVEKAVKDLANAGVLCHIFAQLPEDISRDGLTVAQFNTLSILMSQSKNIRQWKTIQYHFLLYSAFAHLMTITTPSVYDRPHMEVAISTNLFQQKCLAAYEYLYRGILSDEAQKIKDLAEKEMKK
jgi:hypothetical protein